MYFKSLQMKKIFLFGLALAGCLSCSREDMRNYNSYLPDYAVNARINTSLPLYAKLQHAGNAVFIDGYGINGIIVLNTGTAYVAYEATCANHEVQSCSRLELVGVEAHCQCEHALEYNLYLGIAKTDAKYPLLQYRVYENNGELVITN